MIFMVHYPSYHVGPVSREDAERDGEKGPRSGIQRGAYRCVLSWTRNGGAHHERHSIVVHILYVLVLELHPGLKI